MSAADQKKILTRFALGDRCDSLRIIDSLEIIDLRADKIELQEDNSIAIQSIESLQLSALKQRKWPWIAGALGLIGGVIVGTRIK